MQWRPHRARLSGNCPKRCLNSGILALAMSLPGFEVEKSTNPQFIVSVNVTPENVWYARTLM
mgnify:CR=1 FL=1